MNINQTAPEIRDGIPNRSPGNRSALSKSLDILLPREKRHPDDRTIDTLKRVLPYLEKHLEFIGDGIFHAECDCMVDAMPSSITEQKMNVHDLIKDIRAIVRGHEEDKRQEAGEARKVL